MIRATIVAIYLAPAAAAPAGPVPEVHAVAGCGLEGDRYFDGAGTWSARPGGGRNVTLIEAEAVEAARRESGIELEAVDTRRNLVTSGIDLNPLVGKRFRVGEVLLEGVRLADPCAHMAKLAGKPGAAKALIDRGGLRADIIEGGVIRVGDSVDVV